jgi:hypothetical protein
MLAKDQPGHLRFAGSETADLFTREIEDSLAALLRKNFLVNSPRGRTGFLTSSVDGRPWCEHMWTRDAGTGMREMVQWGYFEHAALLTDCLLDLVDKNADGFYAFPEYFMLSDSKRTGSELDGTAAIAIALTMLWQRLPADDPRRDVIREFLRGPASPVRMVEKKLRDKPLLSGSGEFGGGMGVEGEYANVVQNHLAALMLLACADLEEEAGDGAQATTWRQAAEKIRRNMLEHLVGPDGDWLWCVDAATLRPDPAILNSQFNKGFGGLNGVGAMWSDVLGLEPGASGWAGVGPTLKTFNRLLAVPQRKERFEQFGFWSQFDLLREGQLTSPAYGQGYALQVMLSFDRLDLAARALVYLARTTVHPGYTVNRESPYYFYERYYVPGFSPAGDWANDLEGCGALNVVNVAEPLKVARLMLGVDDHDLGQVRLLPRLPAGIDEIEATHWPIRTRAGLSRANLRCRREAKGLSVDLQVTAGPALPRLAVRLAPGCWRQMEDVTRAVVAD